MKLYLRDVVAAALIARKTGALVTEIDGGKWNVFSESILAANPLLHKKCLI